MVRGTVGTKQVLDRRVRMRLGHVAENSAVEPVARLPFPALARIPPRPLEQFEVQHAVDDYRAAVGPLSVPVPPHLNRLAARTPACAERARGVVKVAGILPVARDPVGIPSRRQEHEAEVMVQVRRTDVRLLFRVLLGKLAPLRLARRLVEIPEAALEESAAPVPVLAEDDLAIPERLWIRRLLRVAEFRVLGEHRVVCAEPRNSGIDPSEIILCERPCNGHRRHQQNEDMLFHHGRSCHFMRSTLVLGSATTM